MRRYVAWVRVRRVITPAETASCVLSKWFSWTDSSLGPFEAYRWHVGVIFSIHLSLREKPVLASTFS